MPTDKSRYEFMKEGEKRSLMEGGDDHLETLLREHIYVSEEKLGYLKDLSLDDVRQFIEEIRSQLYIQIGQNLFNSIKLMALLDLFDVIVEKPFFDQLRTKENLGYTVQSFSSEIHNVWGFCFLIHSSDYEPYYLQQKIEEFIDGLEKFFKDLDNETFENYRSSLVETKLQSSPSLEAESYQVWKEITKYSCQFNIAQMVVEELKQITKKDFMGFYRKYFKKSSTNCRRLKVNLWCSEKFQEAGDSLDRVEDVDIKENPYFY